MSYPSFSVYLVCLLYDPMCYFRQVQYPTRHLFGSGKRLVSFVAKRRTASGRVVDIKILGCVNSLIYGYFHRMFGGVSNYLVGWCLGAHSTSIPLSDVLAYHCLPICIATDPPLNDVIKPTDPLTRKLNVTPSVDRRNSSSRAA